MYDKGPPKNVFDKETFVIKYSICITLVAQQGRQIPGMLRMGHVSRIVVTAGLIKGPGAVSVLVNMHTVKVGGSWSVNIGKPEDLGLYENSAVSGLVKFYRACKPGIRSTALDPCKSSRVGMCQ